MTYSDFLELISIVVIIPAVAWILIFRRYSLAPRRWRRFDD